MDFWQLLPQDLVVNHILNRLDFLCRVRAGAVCRAWRDLSRAAPPIAGMPWICHSTYDDHISARPGTIRAHTLINISSSTTRYPRCRPITNNQRFHGSHGSPYLTLTSSHPTSKEKLLHSIYNPFNGDFFPLPSTARDHEGLRHPLGRIYLTQLSSKPPNCVVAAECNGGLCVCRPGDDDWVKLRPAGTKRYFHALDMMFYKGELYCLDEERIMAYKIRHIHDNMNNLDSPAPRRDVLVYHKDDAWCNIYGDERPCIRTHFLVKSGGELLVVTEYLSTRFNYYNEFEFAVHRVDQEQGRLVRVNDLGDHSMLFVGEGCSQSWSRHHKDIVKPSEFFTGNCIYFFPWTYDPEPSRFVGLGKFRLDKGKAETRTSFEVHPEYSFRGLPCTPVWLTPTYPN